MVVLVLVVALFHAIPTALAFTIVPSRIGGVAVRPMVQTSWLQQQQQQPIHSLCMAKIRITTPSSDVAVEMGMREWPQQVQQGRWSEFVPSETTVIRYVLEGSGTLEIVDEDQAQAQSTSLVPGTLIEVTGTASLQWSTLPDTTDMILLTPNFEQGGLLMGVVVSIIALFGALLAGVVL